MFKDILEKYLSGSRSNTKRPGGDRDRPVYPGLGDNEKYIRQQFGGTRDLIIRYFNIAGHTRAMLVYLDNMADSNIINRYILGPLMERRLDPAENVEGIVRTIVAVGSIQTHANIPEALEKVLYGNTAIFVQGRASVMVAETKGWQHRAVEEPETEPSVRGSREGFTESAMINQTLVRRRVRSARLRFESLALGEVTQCDVVLAYIEGLVKPQLLENIKGRLKEIKIDGILGSGYIEELIGDHPLSPFPTITHTEKPDRLAAALLEGRVGIIVDGTPLVLVVPTVFTDFFIAVDDYLERYYFGTFIRWLRYMALIMALILPSLYIAVTTHHHEMLPPQLALSIAGAREGVPFSAFTEALLMEVAFELVREGGLRLPKTVGQTVSIVGALVLGQSAVEARIISSTMVIVVAFTGIASFAIPAYSAAITIRMLRFPLMILAGLWGLPGLLCGLLIIVSHMVSLSSFGVPYLWPVIPFNFSGWKDTIFRAPWWAMITRPIMAGDKKRLWPFIPPGRGKEDK